ncbi:hypothetical protein KKC22_04665 [Myxococcota bacterium]|nr:hypothetical protein [Myxococcota bacterium]
MTAAKKFQMFDIRESSTALMGRAVAGMIEVLEGLEARLIPDREAYTCEDLREYLVSLVEGQSGELAAHQGRFTIQAGPGAVQAGSWSVNSHCEDMPSDARVDFIFFPTYAAVATISRCLLEFPLLAASVPGLVPALQRGLEFSCARELPGHGYEADEQKQQALNLFYLGWVPLLLWQNPDFCPKMNRILEKTKNLDFHVEYEMKQQFGLFQNLFRMDQLRRSAEHSAKLRSPCGDKCNRLPWRYDRKSEEWIDPQIEELSQSPSEEEKSALHHHYSQLLKSFSEFVITDRDREILDRIIRENGHYFQDRCPATPGISPGETPDGAAPSGSEPSAGKDAPQTDQEPPPHVPRPGRPVREEFTVRQPEGDLP